MSAHTPGPWLIPGTNSHTDVCSGPQGALAYVSTAGARGRTLAEAQANARLISACPDLLTACLELINYSESSAGCAVCGRGHDDHDFDCPVPSAKAAVARAKGGTS